MNNAQQYREELSNAVKGTPLEALHAVLQEVAQKQKKVCSLSDGDAEKLYAYGYMLWKQGQQVKARPVFEHILAYKTTNSKYIDALARCCYDLGEYEKTIELYSMSSMCGGDSVHNLLHISYSQFRLGALENCMYTLKLLRDLGKKYPDQVPAHFKSQAAALLELVEESLRLESSAKSYADEKTKGATLAGKDKLHTTQKKVPDGVVSGAEMAAKNPPRKTPA